MKTFLPIYLLVVFLTIHLPGISQTQISGDINRYAKVISVNGLDNVTVDDASGFAAGDTVLIIQMKGTEIDPETNAVIDMNYTGRYEFIAVQQISGGNIVKFRSNFINTYDAAHALQLVRVPYYRYANITSTLTCPSWDGNTGGALALMVFDTLELNADIDVTGKGFMGGSKTYGNSLCYQLPDLLNYLISATDSAGLKGESTVETTYPYKRGRGACANGGGGGNGFGSGGGGGAGYAMGGSGGQASTAYCTTSYDIGGEPGESPKDYFAGTTSGQRDRIFMGGGGGAGRGINANDITNGGNGGGIVFIITRQLKPNNYTIRANGETVSAVAANEGSAGGGGGGGSVMLSFDNVTGLLNVEVTGGEGGNTGDYCSGQGGGGGGGFFWYTEQLMPSGTLNLEGGQAGLSAISPCIGTPGFSGGNGDSANYLNPVLNGFLFNLVGSPQTICYGEAPEKLTGSQPRGGNGQYTFLWQYRNKTTSHQWTDISGADQRDYSPSLLYDTTDFRRVVTSHHIATNDLLIDTSKWFTIKVRPEIKNISIAPSDTAMCFGQNPLALRGETAYGGDISDPISYLWETSTDNSTWDVASEPNDLKDYTQTSNETSMYYRRKVINGICVVKSNTAHIVVYPLITNNNIHESQTICYNSAPAQLLGDYPAGGADSYHYKWLKSPADSLHCTLISAADTNQHYSPGQLTEQMFYRRVALSGLRNTCVDTSAAIKITVLPLIGNNSIQADQTICEESSPVLFTGSLPTGGDGVYHYQWDISDDSVVWTAISSSNSSDFQHGALTSTAYFRRIVFSGTDDCCKDTTKTSIKVTVQPKIQNNIIADNQEICYGQIPVLLNQKSGSVTGGDGIYIYLWQERAFDVAAWTDCSGTNDQPAFQPASQMKTIYFRRKVTSGVCSSWADSLKINVLPLITGNSLSGNAEVCDQLVPGTITGSTASGGEEGVYRYVWQDSVANSTWNNITGAEAKDYTPYILSQKTYFRRMVKSGLSNCCVSTSSPFSIEINPLPVSVLKDMDTAICEGRDIDLQLTITSGTSPFDVNVSNGTDEVNTSSLVNGTNIINFIPVSTGTYTVLSVTDSKGCLATNKTGASQVRLVTVPDADAGVTSAICGLKFSLNATPSVGTGRWTTTVEAAFTPSDTAPNATVSVSEYGCHQLVWTESNEFCQDTASVYITFYEQPQNAEAGDNQRLVFEFTTNMAATPPIVGTGVWTVKNDNITIANTQDAYTQIAELPFGKTTFTWTIANGVCPSIKDTMVIDVDDLVRFTGFSPNNDGKNDCFVIEGLEHSNIKQLKVFNRWGGEVYSSDHYENNWNGTYRNGEPLPNDTYYYVLKADGNRIYKGFFVIKK